MPHLNDLLFPKTADPPPPRPATPVTGNNATAYATAALTSEIAAVQSVPIGTHRNDQLNRSAFAMGTLIAAGAIDEATVINALGAADGGLDYPATARTIRSGIESGKQHPRVIPDNRKEGTWKTTTPSSTTTAVNGSTPPGSTATDAQTTDTTPHTSTPGDPESPSDSPATPADATAALLDLEIDKQRRTRAARRLLDQEEQAKQFRIPEWLPSLTAELAVPDEPITYRVDRIFPTGGNVVVTAQYKTGKTTLINNLAKALADGDDFLDTYGISKPEGRIAVWNYEVGRDQYRRWLRDVGITNTDIIAPLSLRGYRIPLLVPHVEAWVVEWLKQAEAYVWIVDPLARAASGSDEDSNTEMGVWLETLDVIKDKAGIQELIMPTHTGRGEQQDRARGATRINDWADVQWVLSKDASGTRFFKAEGRDVLEDERALEFDEFTRHLKLTDQTRREVTDDDYKGAVLTIIANKPGATQVEIREGVGQIRGSATTSKIGKAIKDLIDEDQCYIRTDGKKHLHYPGVNPMKRGLGET